MTDTESGGDGFIPFASSPGSSGAGARAWSSTRQPVDEAEPSPARSEADDIRICFHESSHAVVGRQLTGLMLGGVTCEPGEDYGGLCWGPAHVRRSKFADTDGVPTLCQQIAELMPARGESRTDVADIYLHCFNRVTELVAGTEGERLFLPDEPWFAADDERQEIAYASLICSSSASAAAFIDFCRVEATTILTESAHIVQALVTELRNARTMDGSAIDLCIQRAVTAQAAADEQARRADWRSIERSAAAFADLQKGASLMSEHETASWTRRHFRFWV